MTTQVRHPELEAFGPLMHVEEPHELESWIGKTVYQKREPGEHPEYTIEVGGEYVQRATEWDEGNRVVIFLGQPQTWKIEHLQRNYRGDIILRGYAYEGDFGRPLRPEDVIEVKQMYGIELMYWSGNTKKVEVRRYNTMAEFSTAHSELMKDRLMLTVEVL